MTRDIPFDDGSQLYVTRAGHKLQHALEHFGVDPSAAVACDLGSNIGGFVDCLLKAGASSVYSVDTSYGTLAWELRNDERVVVMERQNALHVELPEQVDIVTVDVGWTRQKLILPRAVSIAKEGGAVISLIKPQYESRDEERDRGIVKQECLDHVLERTLSGVEDLGLVPEEVIECPIVSKDKRTNREYLMLIRC